MQMYLWGPKTQNYLSYNDNVIVRELNKDFNIRSTKEIEYTLGKNMHGNNKSVREVFITN